MAGKPDVNWPRGGIEIDSAATNNLKNVSTTIPLGRFCVVTGVSGSGKSSLVWDTIYAEGKRRFLEALAVSRRIAIPPQVRPNVRDIRGLPPIVSLSQRGRAVSARSTLATIADLYNPLRILFGRAGVPHCPKCQQQLDRITPQQLSDQVLGFPAGTKMMILAPISPEDSWPRVAELGFVRVRIDRVVHDLADAHLPERTTTSSALIVIDRLIVKEGLRDRLDESIALALKQGNGICVVSHLEGADWVDHYGSEYLSCPTCSIRFPEIEPRLFSFHSPKGICSTCQGRGGDCPECQGSRLNEFARNVRWRSRTLPELLRESVEELWNWFKNEVRISGSRTENQIEQRLVPLIQDQLGNLQSVGLGYLSLDRSATTLSGGEQQRARLAACLGSGLSGVCYLLDEPTSGLHPTDTERLLQVLLKLRDNGETLIVIEHDLSVIRKADYILDLGPGAGQEGGRLIAAGDPASIAKTDSPTGRILARLLNCKKGSVGACDPKPQQQKKKSNSTKAEYLVLEGARVHNLAGDTISFPIQKLSCVTGPSGSGKSSLLMDSLLPLLRARFDPNPKKLRTPDSLGRLSGGDSLKRVVVVDQSPIGRTRRSSPATYSGLWDQIRKVYAATRDAKIRGLKASQFSLLHSAGRCPGCLGLGVRAWGRGIASVPITCSSCGGKGFSATILEVRYKSQTVADVLSKRFDEALDLFRGLERIERMIETFISMGLGYLTLGQSSETLSGGEAQRVKLAAELGGDSQPGTLFLLDEPTSGLHLSDVQLLLNLLWSLVAQGQTVLCIEHMPEFIGSADWIVDLGPGGGPAGGRLVVAGDRATIMNHPQSLTARVLAETIGFE